MSVEQAKIHTRRGDTVTVSLMQLADEEPTLLFTLDDPDDTPIPTAEFTIREAAELREVMRKFSEMATRTKSWEGAWRTTRR